MKLLNGFGSLFFILWSVVPTGQATPAEQVIRGATKVTSIGSGVEVRHTERWKPSAVTFRNAIELVVTQKAVTKAAGEDREEEIEYPVARILITTEPRTNHADALRRLAGVAAARKAAATFAEIGGWPAVEMTFVEEVPRRGQNPPPPAFAQRSITAVAAGAKVVRFEVFLAPNADLGLLGEGQEIARSVTFPERGDPKSVADELKKLNAVLPSKPADRKLNSSATPLTRAAAADTGLARSETGAPVTVQAGRGELEVAASGDANTVVIASNQALAFSTNRGAIFTAGDSGVFSLNDPSLARAVSESFYLGVIAFPNGTAAQLNQTGCTNAVSRSTDSGANFALQGFSATCPQTGAGVCFPDQEHIAADAVTGAATGDDQVYAVWRNFPPDGAATCKQIASGFPTSSISCSQDNGVTWTARAAIAGAGDFPRVAVGRDGSVYAVSLSWNAVLLNKFTSCTSGLTAVAGFPVPVATLSGTVACPVPGLDRCNDGNTLSSPTVAPDPSRANHVFVSFAESDGSVGERVVVTESTTGGLTFPRSTTVSGATSARRFMPWACSARGDAWVGWYDRRATLAPGASNDLTDYFIGSAHSNRGATLSPLTAGPTRNLSNNPDPQCASGWPCQPRSSNDSDFCSPVRFQLAGRCQPPAGGGSNAPCDFDQSACPAGETCQTGGGCPKYGDYNGIACAGNYVFAAWASATAPAGLPAVAGLSVFSSAEYVGSRVTDICRRFGAVGGICNPPSRLEENVIVVLCKRLPCAIVDPVPRNCRMKWQCPGCPPGGMCPPFYHVVFDETVMPWEIHLVDGKGREVLHRITRSGRYVALTVQPSRNEFKEGEIGDYSLVFTAGKTIKPGREYKIRAQLQISEKPKPDFEAIGR